jgi:hypothetical protein
VGTLAGGIANGGEALEMNAQAMLDGGSPSQLRSSELTCQDIDTPGQVLYVIHFDSVSVCLVSCSCP